MAGDVSHSYQIYKLYLQKALEQERSGKLDKAWKLYLNAADSLLLVAEANTGNVREDQIKEVRLLCEKAESLKGGEPAREEKSASGSKEGGIPDFSPELVPDIGFEDIAGLEDVKREVRERVIQPMNNPELYRQFRIKPGGGILMFGLPGTGKTMIARAIAHEVKAPFFHIHCSNIKDKWVGSTERNIAALFDRAKEEKTAVLFFDEFDGLGGKTDEGSGNMRGMLAELKSQMDGFDKDALVTLLLLGATNHPWDIDSAFLRSGRFSKMIYIPLPDAESRGFLMRKQLEEVPVDDTLDTDYLVKLTNGFSGADIVQFFLDVKIRAVTRSIRTGQVSKVNQEDVVPVIERFRSTVMRSDIDLMKTFMQQNEFKIPESM